MIARNLPPQPRRGAPRAAARAYRIVARPYFGILYDDQLWTDTEWYARERRRASWRKYQSRVRAERAA